MSAVWLQSGIIAATYATSIVFGVMLRRGFPARQVGRSMHAADLAVTSLLIYATGGAESPYIFLYALSIVGAGALSYRGGAVVVTLASISLLVGVSLLAWTQAIALPALSQIRPWEQGGVDLVRTLGINLAALIGVGALSFIFGDQLQRGAETLATTRARRRPTCSPSTRTSCARCRRASSRSRPTARPDREQRRRRHPRQPAALAGQQVDQVMPGVGADRDRPAPTAACRPRSSPRRRRRDGVAAARRPRRGDRARDQLPGPHRAAPARASTRDAPSGSRWSASSPPASRTRSATRWRRSRARSSSCASRRRPPRTIPR